MSKINKGMKVFVIKGIWGESAFDTDQLPLLFLPHISHSMCIYDTFILYIYRDSINIKHTCSDAVTHISTVFPLVHTDKLKPVSKTTFISTFIRKQSSL